MQINQLIKTHRAAAAYAHLSAHQDSPTWLCICKQAYESSGAEANMN